MNYTIPSELKYEPTLVESESVGAAEARLAEYLRVIDLYQSPSTRPSVAKHPVTMTLLTCGNLANKGGLLYNGNEAITATLRICFQLGIISTINESHAL